MKKKIVSLALVLMMVLAPSGVLAQTKKTLPKEYNLVKEKLVTPVKNQGEFGDCWAFGALASLESSLIKTKQANTKVDLAERHLAWFAYNGKNFDNVSKFAGVDTFVDESKEGAYYAGGGREMAIATLSRGYGPVDEKTALHDEKTMTGLDTNIQTEKIVSLKEAIHLPETVIWDENDKVKGIDRKAIGIIKNYLHKRGAISVGIYTSEFDKDYNEKTYSFYSGKEGKEADHEVTIVGWKDNYPRENFVKKNNKLPERDGAWIIKNSWGSDEFGDKGLLYVSYEDTSFATPTFFQGQLVPKYENRTYQYDGVGFGDGPLELVEKAEVATNTFVAEKDETVKSFGVTLPFDNSKVTISLYKNVQDGKPTNGEKVLVQTVKKLRGGYYTIPAKKAIDIEAGTKFTVKIKIAVDNDGEQGYLLPCETEFTKDSNVDLDVRPGETHLYTNGVWVDVTTLPQEDFGEDGKCTIGNACIKVNTARSGQL